MTQETTPAADLGRFGHHPDPAIDFCIEVEVLIRAVHDGPLGADDNELVEGSEQCNWIKSVLETGLSALHPSPAHEEAEALVNRLRSYEIFGPLSSLSIHPETPGITTGQVLRDTMLAAAFIARHHIGEKS